MNALDRIISANETLKKIDKPVRVIGIDLGTTNSTVAEITYDPANNIQGRGPRFVAWRWSSQPMGGDGGILWCHPFWLFMMDGRSLAKVPEGCVLAGVKRG